MDVFKRKGKTNLSLLPSSSFLCLFRVSPSLLIILYLLPRSNSLSLNSKINVCVVLSSCFLWEIILILREATQISPR